MEIVTICTLALALSIDALSVSILNGILIKELKVKHAIMIAASFGFFQGLMPTIGFLAGRMFRTYIESYNHWVASALLFVVGIKMIVESFNLAKEDESKTCKTCLEPKTLLLFSVATSLDALAIGLSFSILKYDILLPVIVISVVTFIVCLVGLLAANRFNIKNESKVEFLGGAVLIAIGVKILVEHFLNSGL